MMISLVLFSSFLVIFTEALCLFSIPTHIKVFQRLHKSSTTNDREDARTTRRLFLNSAFVAGAIGTNLPAIAIGPTKITLEAISYTATPCPPNKPIPGEKAMTGMRGLCVTVYADLKERAPKNLEKVGVYGRVIDGETGDSVLANNPDLSTDAGQFAMIEKVTTNDDKIVFEFIAAVPREKELSQYDNGIGPLTFESLRIISYPGGQQFGEISPCEMNEFSNECEAWEAENGPYTKQEYMVKSNPRTKGG